VHVICHSHDDVGWLMDPEEYYKDKVQDILTSVVLALVEDTNRKFT
jgi:hypothetical protein